MPLTAIDLFCGAGGLTQGLKQAGYRVLGAVDVVPVAVETYRANHPEVKVWQMDITQLKGDDVLKALDLQKGELDLLAGCPPCQGFSSLRTRNGKLTVLEPRNELIFEQLRLVEELMPRAVMLENVPALIKDYRFKEVIQKLKALKYRFEDSAKVLNVAEYTVPQRRNRLIMIVGRDKFIPFSEPAKEKKNVRDAIGNVEKLISTDDKLHFYTENHTPKVKEIIRHIPKNGGSRTALPEHLVLDCHKNRPTSFTDVYGRMAWDAVSPTITGGCISPSKGRFLHPEADRTITLREAALLQTFPPKYHFSMSKGRSGASLMIGNALPPAFIEHHARAIANALTEN